MVEECARTLEHFFVVCEQCCCVVFWLPQGQDGDVLWAECTSGKRYNWAHITHTLIWF